MVEEDMLMGMEDVDSAIATGFEVATLLVGIEFEIEIEIEIVVEVAVVADAGTEIVGVGEEVVTVGIQ